MVISVFKMIDTIAVNLLHTHRVSSFGIKFRRYIPTGGISESG